MQREAHDDHPGDRPVTEAAGEIDALAGEVAAHVVEPTADWRWSVGDTCRVVVAGTIVLIGGIAASKGVPSWERATFLKVNGAPDPLYPVLWLPMQLGNIWVGTAVAALAALLVRRPRAGVLLVATPIAAWLIAKGIKVLVGRGRPADVGLEVHQRGDVETGLGYLSGHATVAFALAAALAAHLRHPWRGILLGLAAVVAVARVYVGVHLPLDVIGGAACGLLIGEAARVIELHGRRRPPAEP